MKANKVIVKMSTDANSLDVAQVEPKMRPHRLKMFQLVEHICTNWGGGLESTVLHKHTATRGNRRQA